MLTRSYSFLKLVEEAAGRQMIGGNREKNECAYRVGMQHSEEVRAGEELCTGRLQEQGEAGPGTGLGHVVAPAQLCNTRTHTHSTLAFYKFVYSKE